jgi:hypothetical protein
VLLTFKVLRREPPHSGKLDGKTVSEFSGIYWSSFLQLVPADMRLEFLNRIPNSEIRNVFQSTSNRFRYNYHDLYLDRFMVD